MMNRLLSLSLFQGLTMEQLMFILEKAVPEFVQLVDEPLLRCGERHDRVIYLLEGTLVRETKDPIGACKLQEVILPGSLVEFWTLFGLKNTAEASYYARGEVSLLTFDKKYLYTIFNRIEVVQLNLLNLFCARSQVLQERAFSNMEGTIPMLFLRYVASLSEVVDGPKTLIVSREELARRLSCCRRHLSAYISQWQSQGLVDVGYGQIIILDLRRMQQEMQSSE